MITTTILNNGTVYSGERYKKTTDNEFYSGTLYKKTASGFVETTDGGTVYGSRTEGIYELLTVQPSEIHHTWRTQNGSEYTGNRYLRVQKDSGNSSYPYKVVWEGLFGRSFSENGYAYPTQYKWTEGSNGSGTTQTLLSSFTMLNSDYTASNPDYHLYYQGSSGSTKFYHLRQKLDGTYTTDDDELCIAAYS